MGKSIDEVFPHSGFPYKVSHKDDKETRHCYFMNEVHMNKYIQRYKLDRKKIKILFRDDYKDSSD